MSPWSYLLRLKSSLWHHVYFENLHSGRRGGTQPFLLLVGSSTVYTGGWMTFCSLVDNCTISQKEQEICIGPWLQYCPVFWEVCLNIDIDHWYNERMVPWERKGPLLNEDAWKPRVHSLHGEVFFAFKYLKSCHGDSEGWDSETLQRTKRGPVGGNYQGADFSPILSTLITEAIHQWKELPSAVVSAPAGNIDQIIWLWECWVGGWVSWPPKTLPPQRLIDFMEICIWAKDSGINTLLGVMFWMLPESGMKQSMVCYAAIPKKKELRLHLGVLSNLLCLLFLVSWLKCKEILVGLCNSVADYTVFS